MQYFTADTHFSHHNIIKYCNRPFKSVQEMDDVILSNLNTKIRPQDTLYHLGDFALPKTKEKDKTLGSIDSIVEYVKQINCRNIHLILGNHDKVIRKNKAKFKGIFSSISEFKEIKIDKQSITLCHYGMRVWNKSHYNSIQLFGHSHGMLPSINNSFDVGVDCHDFKPLSFERVKEIALAEQNK